MSIVNRIRVRKLALPAALVCALAAPAAVAAAPATSSPAADTASSTLAKPPASAFVEQCLIAGEQAQRSATFVGEMTAIPGSARMEIRISVLERLPGEIGFHAVTSPGLGVWRSAASGVKDYKYLKQVSDLAAPAVYRAEVRFRWLNDKNHPIRSAEVLTARCVQPAPPAEEPGMGSTGAPAEAVGAQMGA